MSKNSFRSIILLMAAGVLLLSACASDAQAAEGMEVPVVRADNTIVAEGRLEPVQYAELAFNVGGVVGQVYAAEGDPVEAGQVLARLEK
ncbi:MAG: biotin/lipoyl-binding protein, partial [Anaerolineales bacterium]|nr:biotin/lipoyl-binding protein [Anaerolineales bacterium]